MQVKGFIGVLKPVSKEALIYGTRLDVLAYTLITPCLPGTFLVFLTCDV